MRASGHQLQIPDLKNRQLGYFYCEPCTSFGQKALTKIKKLSYISIFQADMFANIGSHRWDKHSTVTLSVCAFRSKRLTGISVAKLP